MENRQNTEQVYQTVKNFGPPFKKKKNLQIYNHVKQRFFDESTQPIVSHFK